MLTTPHPADSGDVSGSTSTLDIDAFFTIDQLAAEAKVGTVFETMLSMMPNNEVTLGFTHFIDSEGVVEALGG